MTKSETLFSIDAGKPLLHILLKQELTNTAIFVERYDVGQKLGVPGLMDAYTKAIEGALLNTRLFANVSKKTNGVAVFV